jgi:hypothetical protein
MKVIAYGFLNCGSTSFIRNYWNVVDTFVVIITVSIHSILKILAIVIYSLRHEFECYQSLSPPKDLASIEIYFKKPRTKNID